MSGWREKLHKWRLLRMELALQDAEEHLRDWAFGMTPSERHRERKRIERMKAKLAATQKGESS